MLIGQTIGPFVIQSELGSGAMGTVFKAQFTKDGGRVIPVALKVVSLGLVGNEGAMARFEREAAILKQLRHPHVVRLLATGRYQRTPFIAMEFVDGESLEKTLARRKRLDWLEVVAHGKQLCEALQHAHDKGIVHRDLKPSNLMVTADGTLKLTDFGIAKDTDVTALTGANSTIGTAAYMSPEQCRGDKTLGPKSDLYSLGVCLYELLTGVKPFTAESTVDLFLKHVNETPTRPRRLAPETPVWLDNLVMFCLEKSKDSRPLDAATVGRMLGEIEEKVRTNQSVGEEVANARRVDRPVGKVAEADREAARQLRNPGAKKKKKKKPAGDAKPPWKLAILVTVPIVLLLGYACYSLLPAGKPPETAEQAFERASAAAGTPEERRAAAESFLDKFPTGPLADKARLQVRAAITDRTESAVKKRFDSKFKANDEGFDPKAYALAIQALEAEAGGRLGIASDLWSQCQAQCPPGPESGALPGEDRLLSVSLGWVADRRATAIRAEIPALQKRLSAKIDSDRLYELHPPFDSGDPESVARRALQLDRLGDRSKAKANWDRLALMTRDEPARLALTLLARQQSEADRLAKEPTAAERAAPIGRRLDADVGRLTADFPAVAARDLRNDCQAILALYADETAPEFAALIKRAKQLLADHPKP